MSRGTLADLAGRGKHRVPGVVDAAGDRRDSRQVMIRKITLSSYMSHVHTELDLAPGLTVLVGPNNCGKSAVVSALESLCRNTAGDFMIRHGAREATVTVETDDDHVIAWKRREQTASYVIDGREIHRLGRGSVPDDLHEKLRLPLVRSEQDSVEFDVHLGHQKEPVFLLDRPASQRATFFASSSDARHLLRMQQLHRQHVQESRAALHRARQEIADLQEQVEVLAPVDRLTELIDEADGQAQSIAQAQASIDALAGWIERYARIAESAKRESARADALGPLAAPPSMHDVTGIQTIVWAMGRADDAGREASERIAALHGLDTVTPPADTSSIDLPLEELIEAMTARVAEIAKHADALSTLEAQSGKVQQEVRQWARDNPTCPSCGAPTDADELLARGHDHG